jgi:hypothetical protein
LGTITTITENTRMEIQTRMIVQEDMAIEEVVENVSPILHPIFSHRHLPSQTSDSTTTTARLLTRSTRIMLTRPLWLSTEVVKGYLQLQLRLLS